MKRTAIALSVCFLAPLAAMAQDRTTPDTYYILKSVVGGISGSLGVGAVNYDYDPYGIVVHRDTYYRGSGSIGIPGVVDTWSFWGYCLASGQGNASLREGAAGGEFEGTCQIPVADEATASYGTVDQNMLDGSILLSVPNTGQAYYFRFMTCYPKSGCSVDDNGAAPVQDCSLNDLETVN